MKFILALFLASNLGAAQFKRVFKVTPANAVSVLGHITYESPIIAKNCSQRCFYSKDFSIQYVVVEGSAKLKDKVTIPTKGINITEVSEIELVEFLKKGLK